MTIGRIGRAHGLKGEVTVEVRTDEPERRFAAGSVLATVGHGTLTISSSRWHQGKLLVRFEDVADRNAAEGLRGVELSAVVDSEERPADPEEFYDRQLVGLRAETTDGRGIGEVVSVAHGAQDLIVIRSVEGAEILVPFVVDLVPTVDLDRGLLRVVDLPGLLSPEEGG